MAADSPLSIVWVSFADFWRWGSWGWVLAGCFSSREPDWRSYFCSCLQVVVLAFVAHRHTGQGSWSGVDWRRVLETLDEAIDYNYWDLASDDHQPETPSGPHLEQAWTGLEAHEAGRLLLGVV